jgi:signal transduction histidine kinase
VTAAPDSDAQPAGSVPAIAGATLLAAVPLVLDAPAALALGLGGAAVTALSGLLVPRLPTRRQTAGELASAAALALLLGGLTVLVGPRPAVVVFAAVLVAAQGSLATIWQTSAFGAVVLPLALVLAAWSSGADRMAAAQIGAGLLALGLALNSTLAALRRQRTAVARKLHRLQGDLENRKSVELRLRETHESLEKQTVALSDTNRRIEKEIEVRRAAEVKALEAARLKDAFLRTISHELRTPLNAIIGYTEGLLEDDPGRPLAAAREDLSRVLDASQRLLALIDGVLDLSRIESGAATVDIAPVAVRTLAEEVVRSSAAAAERAGNTIRLRCEDDLPPLVTDRTRLRQVLLQLLDNACKFTSRGVIRLAVAVEHDRGRPYFVFTVSDTGIGIDPATLDQLFSPFMQADGSTTRRYGGAGIGLAMCRQYCTLLAGEITAESAPGNGSTFTVRLPARPYDPRSAGIIVESTF